jgi:2-keto-4-pentenoate hydratase
LVDATRHALAKARSICAATPSFGTITLVEGYEIGRGLELERIAGGWRRVGWKLGFTNQDLWEALGLDQPFRAPVYAETIAPDRIEAASLVQPRIEPEIVLGLVRDLPGGSSRGEIAAAIGWAAAGLEVVQCHFEGWKMSPAEAVADAGLHAALTIGPRLEITAAQAVGLSAYECVLLCDGRPVATGRGSNVLGGPVEALGWLLRDLPTGLQAGELITTGTLTPAMPGQRGQTWTHHSSGSISLGTAELSLI